MASEASSSGGKAAADGGVKRRRHAGVPVWLEDEYERLRAGEDRSVFKAQFPESRIRKLMKGDGVVGMVSQLSPAVCSKACELFIMHLTAAAMRQAKRRKTLIREDVAQAIEGGLELDFLQAGLLAQAAFEPSADPLRRTAETLEAAGGAGPALAAPGAAAAAPPPPPQAAAPKTEAPPPS